MIPALMLVISVAALLHFGIYYWRALMLGVAAQPLSERMQSLAHGESVGAGDFRALACLQRMCPELERSHSRVGLVGLYYQMLAFLNEIPALSEWTNREMATCSRYVAVITDQRMHRNMARVAALQAY